MEITIVSTRKLVIINGKQNKKERMSKLIVPEIQNNNIKINLKEEREKTLYFEDHFKNSIIDSNDNVLQYMTQSGDTTKQR